ncbi:MAG: sensor domain-containing diguanylate cyclase [Spirochaetes bacterium]|nr:sensor domain-containing diguanylate cyclase [Spirochaetota bacterium]MBU1081452.1 sensor domain-containing diguanylate cyclase [Spirochaetota bacterium]
MSEAEFDDLIRLSYFSETAKSIVSESTVKGVLDRLMDTIGRIFAPLNWSLMLLDRPNDQLVFKIAVGKASAKLIGMRIPAFEGVAGWVVANGRELIIEDASADERWSERVDSMTGFKTESIIAVPLKTEERVFGVIELINKLDGGRFSALELRMLATIAEFAAIAIEKAVYLAQIKRMAMSDSLTGLLNRRGLGKVLERERSRIKRYGGSMAFLLADIDEFKAINDSRGHEAGDIVLKAVADAMSATSRESDAVARLGGDEFLVAMNCDSPEEAEKARERFALALGAAASACPAGPFSVSLGLHFGEAGDLGLLFRESDKDLYRRKEERQPACFGDRVMEALDEASRGDR